jgi:hypothetical protein
MEQGTKKGRIKSWSIVVLRKGVMDMSCCVCFRSVDAILARHSLSTWTITRTLYYL